MNYRIEKDSMGEVKVPDSVYYGAQTQRAKDNFNISNYKINRSFIKALGIIKKSAARANYKLNLIDEDVYSAIVKAADEFINCKFEKDFILDVYQTGSGTSWNMNTNEIISNRANEILSDILIEENSSDKKIHPNDHINRGQSSNDVIPTAMNIAAYIEAQKLEEELSDMVKILNLKEQEFSDVLKIGRTHLQDAVPMTLGQEFSSYKTQFENAKIRLKNCYPFLRELAIGGTAIGTGLNSSNEFKELIVQYIGEESNIDFKSASNSFEAISARDSIVELSGCLNTISVSLMKIANDLRLLSSGPRCGLGEIDLPALQPGSSIMPGKVNPVIPESVIQICATIMGKNQTITIAGQNSPLQLNIMQPLMAYEILEMIQLLKNGINHLNHKCIKGIKANRDNCKNQIEWSLAVVTPLALKIGYNKAAEIAHYAYENGIKVLDAAVEMTDFSREELKNILDISKMI